MIIEPAKRCKKKKKFHSICKSGSGESPTNYTKEYLFSLIRTVYVKHVTESCLPELKEQMALMPSQKEKMACFLLLKQSNLRRFEDDFQLAELENSLIPAKQNLLVELGNLFDSCRPE